MMHRRRSVMIVATALIAGLLVLGGNMASAASIIGSKHDFSTGNTTGNTPFAGVFYIMKDGWPSYIDEVCIFCHTPHGAADPSVTPWLWNRVSTPRAGDTYAMYTSSTVSTGVVSGPTGVSMMCLSCHDGVTSIAVNTLKNPGSGALPSAVQVDTSGGMVAPGAIGNVYNGNPPLYWGANIGEALPSTVNATINLTNDHPISFEWNYSKPDLYAGPTNAALRLFGTSGKRLECATCHRVHDPGIPPFLAMNNANSAMCLSCHNK